MVDTNHWAYDLVKEVESRGETQSPSLLLKGKSFSCIQSTDDLIDCLQQRDVCSEENVEPLRHCSGERLEEAISNYVIPIHESQCSPEPINQYEEQRLVESMRKQMNLNKGHISNDNANTCGSSRPIATMAALTGRKRAAIYRKISQGIGNFWRRFGRELAIGEGAMDQIELQIST